MAERLYIQDKNYNGVRDKQTFHIHSLPTNILDTLYTERH